MALQQPKSNVSQSLDAWLGTTPDLTPSQLVDAAFLQWASGDVFFRTFDPKLLPSVMNGGKSEFVIFREMGVTDHYFGMPVSATSMLNRLGVYNPQTLAHYGPQINATLMLALHRNGFEFFGTMHAPIEYGDNGPVEMKQYTIKSGRLGKILKDITYLGYKMDKEFDGAMLLIPKAILIPRETMANV
jgi:hypothetical protein